MTKWRGERHRNLEDFDSISERSQNNKLGLIHTIRRSLTGSRRARSRGPQRDLSQAQEELARTKVCKTLSAARLQYHIRFSNDQKLFSSSIKVLFILGTSLLDSYELKSPRLKVEGQLMKHSRSGLQFSHVSWASAQPSIKWSLLPARKSKWCAVRCGGN